MRAERTAPTPEQFSAYQSMYDHFNRTLFDGELPQVILNFSRRAGSLGFFGADRWDNGRTRTHEISLNPAHLKERPSIAVASTLVHVMAVLLGNLSSFFITSQHFRPPSPPQTRAGWRYGAPALLARHPMFTGPSPASRWGPINLRPW